jgi:Ca-activated chloride channel family protein
MLWGVPSALLLLLGAIPLILLFHSFRPKSFATHTTTLFLWERVLKERPLTARLGWLLRKNLLLMLQLLAACLLIAALADPSLLHFGALSGDNIVVFDLSASMKARGKTGSRFEAGRNQFLSLVDRMASGQKMMVIGAGAQPRLILPFTADKQRLREAARKLAPSDAPGRIKEAILFAHAFLKHKSADQIVVISDGAFVGAEEFARPMAHLRFVKIDGGENNVGIVGFEVRRRPDRPAYAEIMVRVKNFTARPMRVPLTLSIGAKVLARESIELDAGGGRVVILPVEQPLAGTLRARLEIDDDFATDDQADLIVSDAPTVRLLYVGPGNPFLKNLLRFFPNVEVTAAPAWEPSRAASQQPYDVVVFDRVSVPPLTQGNYILIDTLPPNLGLRVEGKIHNPRILSPLARHSITDGLSLGEVHVRESLRWSAPGGGQVLARSAEAPLLVSLERGKLRMLFIAFDLLASDLPYRVAFPVLLHNALAWLQPRRAEFPAQSAPAGSPFALRLPADDNDVEITTPAGKREVLQAITHPVIFADTFEAGVYGYKSASREGHFAVNLLDENESRIAPRWKTAQASAASAATDHPAVTDRGFSLWPMLVALVLALLAVEALLCWRSGISLKPALARLAVLGVLGAALSDPKIFTTTKALDVVLGVDFSRSVGQEGAQKAREVLGIAARAKAPDTRTGLLFFGRAPEWEFLPRQEIAEDDFAPRLDREDTDIQAALQAAVAQGREGREQKILLISDGNENRGEISRIIPLLRAQGTQVWTLPVTLARGRNEIYLSELVVPRQVDSAESFEIKGAIESLRQARARVKLLRDGLLEAEQEVRLIRGTNTVSFHDRIKEAGSHTYELLVESSDDTLAENNLLQAVLEVKGPPRVLLLSGEKESQRFLSRVLQVQGYAVVESMPNAHPLSLSELSSFDLLVLDNVPAFQLAHAKMENIEKYVRDLGGGLLVIGGSRSYGAGGYFRTPLERILPVDMRPPARLDLPHIALLFVLDKSGSMGAGPEGGTKLDLAKAAAIAAADVMNPTDQVGILSFDAAWDWTLPFRAVGKGEWISEKLASLQSDGGTDLYKAMVEAHRSIAGKPAAIKHVIVLSDGLTDKADFHGLVQRMARDGITVSTVSVGSDADVQLMADIARDGKGRGYVALDPLTIPQIFTTETLLIARDLLVDKVITPTLASSVGAMKGIAQSTLPPLRGYVLTYPKERTELLMKVEKDPLLVSWRYGLGRVMAFTSDLSGRWGREWVSWEGFPRWASQLARDTMRQMLQTRVRTEFKAEDDYVKVIADIRSNDGDFLNRLELKGNIMSPNKETEEKNFLQTAPGRYEFRFNPSQRGIHLLSLYARRPAGEAPLLVTTVPYVVPYPKEYRELKPNLSLLSRVAEDSGGQMLDPERLDEGVRRLYTPTPGKAARGHEMWWPLSNIGLFLFLVDLGLRVWPRRAIGESR